MTARAPRGTTRVGAYHPGELAALHELNAGAVPAVNDLAPWVLGEVLALADRVLVARTGVRVDGFIVLLAEAAPYDSPNYRWFSTRCPRSVCVDRGVVAPHARRRGLGRSFYDQAWRRAHARGVPLACEVNVAPPNPESMTFHAASGFRSVASQRTEGGAMAVSLIVREAA